VDGTFSSYQVNASTTTFTINSFTVNDADWSDPLSWSAKTGADRGLIFLVEGSLWDTTESVPTYVDYSAEVVSATASSITVQGVHAGANLTGSLSFKLVYGQLIRSEINGRPVVFSGPTTFADNDGASNGNDSTPDGVCQVCHTATKYWRNDGTLATHNNGLRCTECHSHKNGFAAGCNSCHGFPPVVDAPQADNGLVAIPATTGSTTAGAHALHATAAGFNFSCDACHQGGMPQSAIVDNNKIQIGFGLNPAGISSGYDGHASLSAPYSYEGTGTTTVTTGGSLRCSNVYCHSNGGWVSRGVMDPDITPPWNTVGPLSCDSCHPYPMSTGPDDPRKDTHSRHASVGYSDCGLCHHNNVLDHTLHSNKVYDVAPAPTFPGRPSEGDQPLTFSYAFAPGGGTCSSNSCHAYWGFSDTVRWGLNTDLVVIPYFSGLASTDTDRVVTFDATRSSCYEKVDGVDEPRTCSYSWDFGGAGSIVGGNGTDIMVYQFDAVGDYTVTLTMTESVTGKTASDSITVSAIEVEVPAAADFSTSVAGNTVTLTATLPPEVVRLYVYWGDRLRTVYADPANDVMTHTYARGGRSYNIRVVTIDAAHNMINYTFAEDPDLTVTLP